MSRTMTRRLIRALKRNDKLGLRHLCRWTGHGKDTPRHDSRVTATIRLRLRSLQEVERGWFSEE